MESGLRLQIVTPSGSVIDEQVLEVTAISVEGEFCVLPNHRPVLTSLKTGRLIAKSEKESFVYLVDAGFFESGAGHVNIITPRCVNLSDINISEIEQEIISLETRLEEFEEDDNKDAADDNVEIDALKSSLEWERTKLTAVR